MHFNYQRALIVREKAISSKSRGLRFGEVITNCPQRRQSHPPDTDSRLLTAMNRGCKRQLPSREYWLMPRPRTCNAISGSQRKPSKMADPLF
jgi:hypothetical protein